jgi:hypothetical protein
MAHGSCRKLDRSALVPCPVCHRPVGYSRTTLCAKCEDDRIKRRMAAVVAYYRRHPLRLTEEMIWSNVGGTLSLAAPYAHDDDDGVCLPTKPKAEAVAVAK